MPVFFRPPRPPRRRRRFLLSSGVSPLAAEAAAFVFGGQPIATSTAWLCEPAGFDVVAQDAVLIAAQPLPAEAAEFALAPQDLVFAEAFVAAAASFSFAGNDAGGLIGFACGAAALSIDGQGVSFIEATNLAAGAASFAIGAQAVTFADRMALEAAAFTVAGQVTGQAWAAGAASFAIAGQTALFAGGLQLAAASFSINGQAIAQRWSTEAVAFAIAGQDAILRTAIGLIASGASFAIAGKLIWSTFAPDHPGEGAVAEFGVVEFPGESVATTGASFAIAGQALAFRPALAAEVAAFALAGQAANQAWTAAPASFAFAGQSVSLVGILALEAGAFVLAGQGIGQAWAADPAAFVVSGLEIVFTEARTAEAAAFTIAGVDVHFLDLEAAAFAIDGQPLAFTWSLAAGAGAFTVNGQDVVFLNNLLFGVAAGAFAIAPQDAGFGRGVGAEPGVFVISGQDVAETIRLLCAAASFVATGRDLAFNVAFGLATGQFVLLGVAVADVTGPSGDHIFLIEVQAHDGEEVLTFHLGSSGFRALPTDAEPNVFYAPRVKDPGNFAQRIGLPGEDEVSASSGDIVIASGDRGDGVTLDDWPSMGFGNRPIVIRALPVGARSLASAATLFRGRTQRLLSTSPFNQLSIRIGNKLTVLDTPLLTARFAGTTTATGNSAEGNVDLKDQLKQQCWGECSTVPLQFANPYDNIYLVSNVTAFSQLVSIQLYDGGLPLINDGDDPDIATLRANAGSTADGHYRTCLALGLVMVGTLPVKRLTADVVEGTNPEDRTAAQIALRMLRQFGVDLADISAGSFDDLDSKNDAVCYAFVSDDRTALSEIKVLLNSIGGRLLPNRNDLFEVTRFEAPVASPTLDFDLNDTAIAFERIEGSPPTWEVELLWGRVHVPQQEGDVLADVSSERRDYLGKEIRPARKYATDVKIKHLDAGSIRYETRLAHRDDAEDEAQRLLDLMKVERDEYRLRVPLAIGWAAQVGGSVVLRHPNRLGLAGGKAFALLERSDVYRKEQVGFDRLWG